MNRCALHSNLFRCLLAGWLCEWSGGWWRHSITAVLSPSQAVKFDVLVIDQPSRIQLDQSETLDPWIDWLSNAIETPLPDKLIAVDRKAEGVDLWDGWC